jgi:hypothetical protein
MKDFTIDREKKAFVFNDGEVIPIPKDKEKQVLRSKAGQQSKKEAVEKWQQWQEAVPIGEIGHTALNSASENVFGNLGDTIANYGVSGIKAFQTGEGQEGMGYVDRVLDHFYAMQEGRQEHLAGLQQKNPTAATIGKGAGIGLELGSMLGVPGAVALPAMAAGNSQTSFLEPGEKSKELVKSGIEGLILDKFFGGLSKVAGHRESQRGIRNLITQTEERNAAELARASGATQADKLRFTNQSTAREAELQRLAQVQQTENQAFQQANNASVNRVARTMGKQSVSNEALGVEEFITNAIDTSAHAASSEGNFASKFLRTVFKGDKNGRITGQTLTKGVQALDEAILKSEGTVKQLLTDYKSFLNQSLPDRLASGYVFEKWAPKITNGTAPLEKKLSDILSKSGKINETLTQRLGKNYVDTFNNAVNQSINDVISMFKGNLHEIDPAILRQEIAGAISATPEYQKMMQRVDTMFPQLSPEMAAKAVPEYGMLRTSLEKYPEILAERIAKNADKYKADIANDFLTKGGVTKSALSKAPVSPTVVPQPPQVQPAQTFQPLTQPVPVMPELQGVYGKLASGLESLRNTGVKETVSNVKNNLPTAMLAKLAGLPVAKAAAAGAAVATGARALTSPSVGGKALRAGLEQGTRAAMVIDQLAQKYPSYHDGVIEDPQERRSLTKEIENDREMSMEDKAVFQSKVNRGKPLQERL